MRALLVAAALMLAACEGGSSAENPLREAPHSLRVFDVDVGSRSVWCIFARSGYGGGLSCDW